MSVDVKRRRFGPACCLAWALVLAVGCGEAAYRQMNDPSRDVWQKPTDVIKQLDIQPGATVADLGAGGGYFTWYLAEAVGPEGVVYAGDVNETALRMLSDEVRTRRVANVRPIRATQSEANLPEPVDLLFTCDTYHHLTDRVAYFRALRRSLSPHGRIAILDFHPKGFFPGFLGHGTDADVVRLELEAAGYQFLAAHNLVDRQHFQIFSPRDPEMH